MKPVLIAAVKVSAESATSAKVLDAAVSRAVERFTPGGVRSTPATERPIVSGSYRLGATVELTFEPGAVPGNVAILVESIQHELQSTLAAQDKEKARER